MFGFKLFEKHKRAIVDNGPFSTKCILRSPEGKIQDDLNCFSPYIGIDVNTDTGLGVFADRAEITINLSSVKIGTIAEDWLIDVYYPMINQWVKFKCEHVAIDRMLGIYLIKPSLAQKQIQSQDIKSFKLGRFNETNF